MIKESKERKRKSEALSAKEHVALLTWISKQPTKLDAADTLKMSRNNLDRVAYRGSCSPETATRIRTVLSLN
jgi:hypothetical protein